MKIAVGNSRMDKKWKNQDISWADLCARCASTIRTTETVEEYRKFKKSQQDGVKDDIPYITCKNGEQILADVTNGTRIGYKYFAFSGPVKLTLWLRGSAEGTFTVQVGEKVVGTIAAAPSEAWQPHSLTLTATGTQALYLIYKGKGRAEMQALAFEEV